MKKIVVGLVVILVLGVAGMPFVSGMIMEKGVRHSVDEFNNVYADMGPKARIDLIRYDRGYSSSEIEYKLSLGEFSKLYGVEDIILVERAKHTYTGAKSQTSLEKNSWYNSFINTHLGGQDLFSLVTEYSLAGDFRSVFSLNPFTMNIEGEKLEMKPAEFVVESDFGFKQMKTSGSWQGLKVSEVMDISGLSINSDLSMISTYIWDGDMSLTLEEMSVNEKGINTKIADLKGDYLINYNQESNTLDFDVVYGIGNMTSSDEYINNASINLGVKRLDAAAYEEAMKLYMEMVSAMMSEVAAHEEDPEQMAQAVETKMMEIGMKMMGIYEKFLKGGLEIYVRDLHATVPQGDINGSFSLHLDKDLTMAQMFPMMNQPDLLFDYLSFQADFSMPTVLSGGNQQLTSPIYPGMKTGLFIEEGDKLVHSSLTKDKQLYINGELLSLKQ